MAEYGYVGNTRAGDNIYECLEDGEIVRAEDLAAHELDVHGNAPPEPPVEEPDPVAPDPDEDPEPPA